MNSNKEDFVESVQIQYDNAIGINFNFISIGGWCGTKYVLRELDLFNEPSLPFDSVRTSIEGIIDCFENDFKNYFPKELKIDNRFTSWVVFVGEYVGFYHNNHNLLDKNVIESFERKIIRFDEKIKKTSIYINNSTKNAKDANFSCLNDFNIKNKKNQEKKKLKND
jgi:hypothetical protein